MTLTPVRAFIFIILTAVIWSCGQRSEPVPADEFVVKTYAIALDANVQTTIFYKNHYYCLTESKQLICLNHKLEVDTEITNSINQMQFNFSYLSGDTLIAERYINDSTAKTYYLDENQKWQPTTKTPSRKPFFEDERFVVSTCCMGEFGGAIFFTDKTSKRVYSCPLTCARIINKVNGSYYVTNTLAHMAGFTGVLKIEDPTRLYELKDDSLKNSCNWYMHFLNNEDPYESVKQFKIGTQRILDTLGVLIMTSFVHENQLYHLNTDFKKTFISKIQGDSLLLVDSIFNKPLWSFEPGNEKYESMHLCSFNYREASGFFTISNDTISIITFDHDKKKNSNR